MTGLLHIAPPTHRFPREALEAAGGFMWWYTDVIDADGNGLVLIWSFGLPFLPGYASSARRGSAPAPRSRPSVTVAVMQEYKLACFVLHELEPEDARWDGGDTWEFGDCRFHTEEEDERRSLSVELNCPLPGGQRLTGSVELRGTARRPADSDAVALVHDWAPLTGPATTSVALQAGDARYEFEGRGYFDGNVGESPLHDTGIASWTWGRFPTADAELIYYVLWPAEGPVEAHGVEIDGDGVLKRFALDVEITREKLGIAGLRHPAGIELSRDGKPWCTARASAVVDDGPFYLRYFIEGMHDGEPVNGIGEFCRTDRIDLGWQRPLVRMRVQRADGRNSIWLPLFAGPRQGRVQRLLRGFVGR